MRYFRRVLPSIGIRFRRVFPSIAFFLSCSRGRYCEFLRVCSRIERDIVLEDSFEN